MSPPRMLSADCNWDRSSAAPNAVPSGPSCDKSRSTRSVETRGSVTSTWAASSSCRPCSAPLRPSSACSGARSGANDMDSGCGFGEQTLEGSSESFGRMGSDVSRDIGSGGAECVGSSCSTSSSPSTTSGSSGRGARGSLTSPSSSLNCCYGRITDIEMCIYATLAQTYLNFIGLDPFENFEGGSWCGLLRYYPDLLPTWDRLHKLTASCLGGRSANAYSPS